MTRNQVRKSMLALSLILNQIRIPRIWPKKHRESKLKPKNFFSSMKKSVLKRKLKFWQKWSPNNSQVKTFLIRLKKRLSKHPPWREKLKSRFQSTKLKLKFLYRKNHLMKLLRNGIRWLKVQLFRIIKNRNPIQSLNFSKISYKI